MPKDSSQKCVPAEPRFLKRFWFAFFIFCFPLFSWSQSYDFTSYNVENGLPQSKVTALCQDSRGLLWIGTAGGGACSFDGINFTEYNENKGLGGNIITSVTEDKNGNMWFASTWGELTRFDGREFVRKNKSDGLPGSHISSLVCNGDQLLGGTSGGIITCNISTMQIGHLQGPGNVSTLFKDSKGKCWIGAGGLIYYLENGRVSLAGGQNSTVIQRTIYAMSENGSGQIIAGTSKGILTIDMATKSVVANTLPMSAQFDTTSVTAVRCDAAGNTWLGTESAGLYRFSKKQELTHFDEQSGLSGKSITVLLEDNTHRVWIGTGGNGLYKLCGENFRYYQNIPGLNQDDIFAITESADGKVYVGSHSKGLYVYDGKQAQAISVGGAMKTNPAIRALLLDSTGQLWVAHGNGVSVLRGSNTVKQLLTGTGTRSLLDDHKGNIWIGTTGSGLYKFDGKTLTQFLKELPHTYVHSLLADAKGNIWIGTGNGLCKYDGVSFSSYINNLCNTYIGSMAVDQLGHIWCGTDKCIARFDGSNFKSYDEKNGLRSSTIYLVTSDDDGHIWVGTNKGVDRLSLDSKGELASVRNFGIHEGFRGVECNSRATFYHNSHIWFGTVKGLIQYNEGDEISDPVPPKVNITEIDLFLEKTSWIWQGVRETGWYHTPESLELQATQNHLTFRFNGIQLNNPAGVRFQFMLEGFDKSWLAETEVDEITYSNLSPGNYLFKVKARNADGTWSSEVHSCAITILSPPPPFWRSWWFILILLVGIGAFLFNVTVVRTRRIRRQKELLEDEVRLRTLEISKQNEEKTVMLKEIHHRVKNNLQIISSLINLQSDNITDPKALALFDECRHRIISMAMIHEKMYQSKNLVNIDIRSYINELISYLIDAYDLHTTVRLETEIEDHPFIIDTIVPLGLILNETISNSLKYAFVNRKEGKIFVSLRKKSGNQFELFISDDGVGMPQQKSLENAETLGLQLIHMLTEQLSGQVHQEPGIGTRYRIIFTSETE